MMSKQAMHKMNSKDIFYRYLFIYSQGKSGAGLRIKKIILMVLVRASPTTYLASLVFQAKAIHIPMAGISHYINIMTPMKLSC
jgi:hypothetical protein